MTVKTIGRRTELMARLSQANQTLYKVTIFGTFDIIGISKVPGQLNS